MAPHGRGLVELPLQELLARVAARTPAPGGGSTVAVTCALAAALVEMAAAFAPARTGDEIASAAAALRGRALTLAELELESYAPVLKALARAASDPERGARVAGARAEAAEVPLEIAEVAAEVAELAAAALSGGSPHLAGDAIAGAVLAEAACRAAAELVAINLSGPGAAPDDRCARAAALSDRAAAARAAVLAHARGSGGR